MNENFDILKSLENLDLNSEIKNIDISELEKTNTISYTYETIVEKRKKENKGLLSSLIFLVKYVTTSAAIFAVLLFSTNYSAYYNVAKSYIMKWQAYETQNRLLNSVEASNIKEKALEEKLEENSEEKAYESEIHRNNMEQLKKDLQNDELKVDIEITPYTNRIVIPKIWKNIPLLDVQNRVIQWENELNNIFMEELENWVVRYPWSAKPGDIWTSFVFGHSSNFPWIDWEYNDVFATLDNVAFDDEVIVYYWQEKYRYKIKEKKVIKPGDVSVLERNVWKSEISIMTCWPIGTTLNRLIVTWELVEEK